MSKFKKGDRVKVEKCSDNAFVIGKTGTVIGVDGNTGIYAVEFDDYVGGHNAKPAYEGRDGHCWFLTNKELKPASKFEAGQVYRARADGSISIIKITSSTGYYVTYETIRSKRNEVGSFLSTSLFAKRLEPLVGPQIGEAIREWDEEHAQKSGVREVNRQANVGDYIKITDNAYGTCGCYKLGDILEVFQRKLCGVFAFTQKAHPDHSNATDKPTSWISDDEYVVLEGYKPEQKGKHVYTANEILKSKEFVLDTVLQLAKKDINVIFSHSSGRKDDNSAFSCYIFDHVVDVGKDKIQASTVRYNSVCSENDEPNEWVGKAVALCRALKRPIPNYVR